MERSEPAGPATDGVVLVAEDPNGALVVGTADAVAAFVAGWEPDAAASVERSELSGADRASALSAAADLGCVAAGAAQYVRARRAVDPGNGGRTVLRLWEQGADGRIVGNRAVDPRLLLAGGPATVLATVAVRAAIDASTREIIEAVERVEAATDEILRLAGAHRAGDVRGHHGVLRRRVSQLDEGADLSDTDWSAVAPLGPALEVGVERLRDYAVRLVGDLPPDLPVAERADRLDRVARDGRLAEVLDLLVTAEQSLYLWQRLRIQRIQDREPHLLDAAVADAHATLADHLRADGLLAENLRTALSGYGALRALEFHRKWSGRRAKRHVEELRKALDGFVTARGMQVRGWEPIADPSARDALNAARTGVVDAGRSVRALGGRLVDGGVAGIDRTAGAVQSKAEQWRRRRSPGTDQCSEAGDTAEASGAPET